MHRSLRAVDNNILLSRLEPHMTASPDELYYHLRMSSSVPLRCGRR
ncbi:MAG: hypothetical protein MZV63_22595 [Marinilabiliales bacterium]|nr:hypothetical protein [Marinilabiliales bacterium]